MTPQRKTALGSDPFDDLVAPKRAETKAREAVVAPEEKRARGPRKKHITFHLDPQLVERTRDAVVFLQGKGEALTLAGFVGEALEAHLTKAAKKHHGGKAFPKRKARQLRTGRPIE